MHAQASILTRQKTCCMRVQACKRASANTHTREDTHAHTHACTSTSQRRCTHPRMPACICRYTRLCTRMLTDMNEAACVRMRAHAVFRKRIRGGSESLRACKGIRTSSMHLRRRRRRRRCRCIRSRIRRRKHIRRTAYAAVQRTHRYATESPASSSLPVHRAAHTHVIRGRVHTERDCLHVRSAY